MYFSIYVTIQLFVYALLICDQAAYTVPSEHLHFVKLHIMTSLII